MKESYGEDAAHHTGSESCLDGPRGSGEALTGESTGELLNSENTKSWEPSRLGECEGEMDCCDKKRAAGRPSGVRELGMCGHSLSGNQETSGRSLPGGEGAEAGVTGKVNSQTPVAESTEESDGNKVPKKSPNKGGEAPAEAVEGKTPTERNSGQEAANRMQSRQFASNGLDRVRQRAEADKTVRFNNLYHFLKADLLRESFYELKRNAAPGVDGVTWREYELKLETRLPALENELHEGRYRATPAKRGYITKEDGRQRPLGIQAVEEKVVQQACVTILNAVFEPTFKGYSYGSRPGRCPHDALDALHEGIVRRKINWILDCDIEGFFDNLSHVRLLNFIEERVMDKRMLRLIRKWLRVGWIEDGKRHPGTIGTPQGSVISPLLANIFLNAVMDKWASEWRRVKAKGDVIIVRYVDDAVFGFQYEADGRAFLEALREQVEASELKLHPTKTRLIEFGRYAASNRRERKLGKPGSFDFLGFTHTCSVNRNGRFCILRKTIRKRLRRKLMEVKTELIRRMHNPLESVAGWLASVIRGFTNYHAVPGNMKAPREFYTQVSRLWRWAILRRSNKAKNRWTWERFYRLQRQWLPRPRLVHPYPSVRFDAKYSR
jgi:RNA-directed DNA polymerase